MPIIRSAASISLTIQVENVDGLSEPSQILKHIEQPVNCMNSHPPAQAQFRAKGNCVTPFLSSTFIDLVPERKAVLEVLRKKRMPPLAMEDFVASARTPADTALKYLRKSDLMLLVIGFKAGSLLPDGSGATYTSAEYDEVLKMGKTPLVFVKQKKKKGQRNASWHNEETNPIKKKALDDFKAHVGEQFTWVYFTTPESLALAVVLALEDWESEGRPGGRTTFASTSDYFAGKNPTGHFQILDFGTTLLGREEQISALNDFAADPTQRVCILSGKGGIGKSKLLFDWANSRPKEVIFLKDEPLWLGDSEKEIPADCQFVIVDDAHRQPDFGKTLQLLQDTTANKNLKLIVSTRPGSKEGLVQQINKKINTSKILRLPDLEDLTKDQSRALAEQVLGDEFGNYAEHLAVIGSNSPLVIVAGGRLIASRKIDPSTLTTLQEFRSTIFGSLLDEMELNGPKFTIDPPRPVLDLIAALGPIDVEKPEFREAAEKMLDRRIDEIFSTIDVLVTVGVITPRSKPTRVIPDVLSDFLLEARCLDSRGRSTRYADQVYEAFGGPFLKSLMRNLSELDWLRGQVADASLNLLGEIWTDIHHRFRSGDEYARHSILTDLSGAAIYQPDHVIGLVRTAIANPIKIDPTSEGSHYRVGQDYVLSVLPGLLEATAYHVNWTTESIDTLWELALRHGGDAESATGAKGVLKRLSSWHRFGNPSFNFAMLLQAIRLTRRADAFKTAYTPFAIIRQILEKDGEFNEWQDEMTMSFGGFGLNYAAVGPVRENAIDFLESVLEEDGRPAVLAVDILEHLLHNYLNRMGRPSTEHENEWQGNERQRCLQVLIGRYERTASPQLRAAIFDALRSATAVNCPESIRQAASEALATIAVNDEVAVIDAIRTAEHELPVLSTDFSHLGWEESITKLMEKGRASLERLIASTGSQARFTIDQTRACLELQMTTGGFHRFMFAFADRPEFLSEMADQLITHPHLDEMVGQLSSVMGSIHASDPAAFRQRALSALEAGAVHVIHASANNLRVFADATEQDIAVIQAYGGYPDPVTKRGAIHAIAYMGKFTELRQSLKEAALSIHAEGDKFIATDLVDAFGIYGVPLTSLTREEAAAVVMEFLPVEDWDHDQAAIPRFLSVFVNLFPDETYDLLLKRIETSIQSRVAGRSRYRTFDLVRGSISFGGVPAEKRAQLAKDCIDRVMASESVEELAELYWAVAGYDTAAYDQVLVAASNTTDQGVHNLVVLIDKAIPNFIFINPGFAKDLVRSFIGERRQLIVDALANQVTHLGSGVYAGSTEDFMQNRRKRIKDGVAAFPEEPGFEDLMRALRRFV
ncbi:MAG: DUF4062 domain-containing protein [Edaphobacter sp.]|uniref:DUF4062 domain-containing protein n=1 Tax=Edaphobacter sp. TaxID=1934404 RepID=UPI00298195F8|nr:DUF4062 domain-containing protein [Edaphobacter sp.]MDW5266113.1 DUF4062 domain-containing protein [Edaphobacter sp.]